MHHYLYTQEEYYVTHQCFLSTRSLYVMVWDITKGEKGIAELGPWLHNIQVHAFVVFLCLELFLMELTALKHVY